MGRFCDWSKIVWNATHLEILNGVWYTYCDVQPNHLTQKRKKFNLPFPFDEFYLFSESIVEINHSLFSWIAIQKLYTINHCSVASGVQSHRFLFFILFIISKTNWNVISKFALVLRTVIVCFKQSYYDDSIKYVDFLFVFILLQRNVAHRMAMFHFKYLMCTLPLFHVIQITSLTYRRKSHFSVENL